MLSITYRKMEVDCVAYELSIKYELIFPSRQSVTFMELLALDSAHIGTFVGQYPETMRMEGDVIVFTPNSNNQPKLKTFKEAISFERMLPVLDLVASSNSNSS